ncbi:MAG: hypothetical protein RLZZ142_2334 [Verrucomicrobiota bacterium]
MRDFEAKHAPQYSSKFPQEPASRPAHIPTTILVNSQPYPVYYDWRYGGYGYWDGPVWRAYEVMRDAVMLNALMNRHSYSVYDGGGYGPRVHVHSSSGGFFAGLLCLLVLVVIVVVVVRRSS